MHLIKELRKNNKKVFLIGPVEIPGFKLPSIVSRELAFKKNTTRPLSKPKEIFYNKYKESINLFRETLGKNFLETYNSLCDLQNCYFADTKGSNFSDSNHLSHYGSKKMEKYFLSIFIH